MNNKKESGFSGVVAPLPRIGNYLIGPKLKVPNCPVQWIEHFLARKDGTEDFYVVKILKDVNPDDITTMDIVQERILILTEHSILSKIGDESGIIHEHGLLKDTVWEPFYNENGERVMKAIRKMYLFLDCFIPHDFHPKYLPLTNLAEYLAERKKLPEAEAIRIFYKVVEIVDRLHKANIIHRNLKLGNIIFNKVTNEVALANFWCGMCLRSENEYILDKRIFTPHYTSPEIIRGKPYLGKPADMWALGVMLYTMLYGSSPFNQQTRIEIYRMILLGKFEIPIDMNISSHCVQLIKSLLQDDVATRPNASEVLEKVRSIIHAENELLTDSNLQVVPASSCDENSLICVPGVGSVPRKILEEIYSIFKILVRSEKHTYEPIADEIRALLEAGMNSTGESKK